MKKNNTLGSVFLLFGIYCSQVQAQELSVSSGFATRKFVKVEESIKDYVQERQYTKEISGIEESINLNETKIPYVFLTLGYIPRESIFPPGTLEHQLELNWTSSIFGEQTDTDKIPLEYHGADIGDAEGVWSYKINAYSSISIGSRYIPIKIGEQTKIKLAFNLRAGLSYIDADVGLDLSLADNKVYQLMDPVYLGEVLGIAEETSLNAHIYGWGYFFHPLLSPSLDFGKIELELQYGYRTEHIPVTVEEKLKSIAIEKDTAKGKVNISGKTVGIEVKYTF